MLNFRVVSGMTGHGGRRLRADTLFRSGAISAPEDARSLFDRGVRHVYDLRNRGEALRDPSALPAAGVIQANPHHDIETGSPLRALRSIGGGPADTRAAMIGLYRQLAVDFSPVLRTVLLGMTETTGGLLIHCAVGKDRTGVTVALLLRLLGVHPDLVLADYLASIAARDHIAASILRRYPGPEQSTDPLLEPLVIVDAAYLEAYFLAIGPVDAYLRQALELEEAALERLRDRFME